MKNVALKTAAELVIGDLIVTTVLYGQPVGLYKIVGISQVDDEDGKYLADILKLTVQFQPNHATAATFQPVDWYGDRGYWLVANEEGFK